MRPVFLFGTQSFDGIEVGGFARGIVAEADADQRGEENRERTEPTPTTVFQLASVETTADAAIPRTTPAMPPAIDRVTASTRNCVRMSRVLAPRLGEGRSRAFARGRRRA